MSAPELLPCPFCGESLIQTGSSEGYTHNRRVKHAKECFVSWIAVRPTNYVDWNTRAAPLTAMTAERDALATAGRAAYLRLLELARQDMLNKSETEDMEKLGSALRVISGKETA